MQTILKILSRPSGLTLLFVLLTFSASTIAQHRPFPQHTKYHKHIKPSAYTQEELDNQVRTFYDTWKSLYLKKGCETDQYYVFFDDGNTVTVSEAMGYGMMIMPLMAGYDPEAREYFDGMFRYYKAHPSGLTPHLMAWKQITGCINADGDDSASDGDIDIAFGLLLAHEQWGSTGAINYLYFAKMIIDDIMGSTAAKGDINQNTHTVKLGDWVQSGEYMTGTRTSDFITDHFKAFSCVADDSLSWANVVEKCYSLIDNMQQNYSSVTGLLPDFIVDTDGASKPAPADYLEGDLDGHYSYNACRDPWRLTTDYLVYGDERALNAVVKINSWILNKTGGDASKIYAGYYLNGNRAVSWKDVSFTAPFAVGAMLDATKQDWLNNLYSEILSATTADAGYYGNTIKLLSMITISGNYWVPPCQLYSGIAKPQFQNRDGFSIYASKAEGSLIINLKNSLPNEKTKVNIYNSCGTLMKQQLLNGGEVSKVFISNFPAGLYLITLFTGNGKSLGTKKFIWN